MSVSRRSFIRNAASVAVAAPALQLLGSCASGQGAAASAMRAAPVELVPDATGFLDLPAGFSAWVVSRTGDRMSDGLLEPGAHDGMAAFPVSGDADRCLIVRNHELGSRDRDAPLSAFAGETPAGIDVSRIYDRTAKGRPLAGGTTTLLVNLKTQKTEKSWLSLAGTAVNCAGGPTPWGSWLSCEETELTPGEEAGKAHGFVFEVPSSAASLVTPVPLTAMGRFAHEAAAVDPQTGAVYLTEDTGDSLLYRFLPERPGELARGGRLQALALLDKAGADTRNWGALKGGDPSFRIAMGQPLGVRWVDLDGVESPDGDLRRRGRAKGAAVFARGEGMAFALDASGPAIYFACTSGGAAGLGQIWRYRPGSTVDKAGVLDLFVEATSDSQFEAVDNIVASPRGDIVLAEDGQGDNFVRGVTPEGVVYPIARNRYEGKSEFCGPCFSPDGQTLFVNVQRPGVTLAIKGPWDQLRRDARRMAPRA
jgi:secreted PhoX family phosphatase